MPALSMSAVPGKGWFPIFRFYGPLEPLYDKAGNSTTSKRRAERYGLSREVRYWHLADIDADAEHVRSGGRADIPRSGCPMSANDPKRTIVEFTASTPTP